MEVVITYREGEEGGVDGDSEINFKFCLLSTRTLSDGFAKIGRGKTRLLINHRKKVVGLKNQLFLLNQTVFLGMKVKVYILLV